MGFAQLFRIGATWLYPPDGYDEILMPTVGYNLKGEPIRQAHPNFVFTWSLLKQEHMTTLVDAYGPVSPQVQISYVDEGDRGFGLPLGDDRGADRRHQPHRVSRQRHH